MIGEACESAEKVLAEGRKDLLRTKGHTTILPTIDVVKAALIRQEEEVIRRAVTHGEGATLMFPLLSLMSLDMFFSLSVSNHSCEMMLCVLEYC